MGITRPQIDLKNLTEDRIVGAGIKFERIRRITGYLVGTLDRFNDGKAAEVRDRVTHMSFKSLGGHDA